MPTKTKSKAKKSSPLAAAAGRASRRAARTARKIARLHGTPIYLWRDGKVVAENREIPAILILLRGNSRL